MNKILIITLLLVVIISCNRTSEVNISIGDPAPEFIDFSNSEEGLVSSSDFAGKYIYYDLWATNCSPCIVQIPFMKKMEALYKNKNIAFVSISVDDNKGKWKSVIINKAMTGIQLIADNSWESTFMKGFNVNYVPRYILVDDKGVIIDLNAPRPADSTLIAELFKDI